MSLELLRLPSFAEQPAVWHVRTIVDRAAPTREGVLGVHIVVIVLGGTPELEGEDDGAIDGNRETAVAPAQHNGADHELRERTESARERVVCLSGGC